MSRPSLAAIAAIALFSTAAGAQDPAPVGPADQGSLRAFLEEAARINAEVPDRLRAYRATVESEISLSLVDADGQERNAQIEQIASAVRWRAPDRYDQRVVGYRSRAVGPSFSLMSIFGGWTIPTLYGNDLQLGVRPASAANLPERSGTRRLSVHPLADTRDRFYEFTGGDTVAILATRERRIPIVRIVVTPRSGVPGDAILFEGEMHLDADRRQIVRMRGRMVEVEGGRQTVRAGSRVPGASGASFVELVNGEFGGEFWLPVYQRTEIQARLALLGEFRTIVRIVSRFGDYSLNDSTWFAGVDPPPGVRHHLTFAPGTEQAAYRDWRAPIGAASADVAFRDFDDLAPGQWAPAAASTLRFVPRTLGDVFRFNRVEGVYTGAAAGVHLDRLSPGLSLYGAAGWAWAERTMRGRIIVEQSRGVWGFGATAERALAHTNDFEPPMAWSATFPALLGSTDDFDYVDRRSARLHAVRTFGAGGRSSFRVESGIGSDSEVRVNISRGLNVEGEGFRPVRGIRPGRYLRSIATVDIDPAVTGLFVNRGVGARIRYDRADGDVGWGRVELRLTARRELGPFELFARAEGGMLAGAVAPQALFEIGRREGLAGYGYKEFGGDRAAIGRAMVGYTLPVLRAPILLPGRLVLPGLAPGIAGGVNGGWTEVSGPRAREALMALGTYVDPETGGMLPLSRPTDGVVGSVEALVTFFSGALSFGAARPFDGRRGWSFVARIGQGFW